MPMISSVARRRIVGGQNWRNSVASFRSSNQFQVRAGHLHIGCTRTRVHGVRHPKKLWSTVLSFPPKCAMKRHDGSEQVWFNQNPETGQLQPQLETRGTNHEKPNRI